MIEVGGVKERAPKGRCQAKEFNLFSRLLRPTPCHPM